MSEIKNYIVSAVRPIRNGWHLEKNQDLYKAYEQMYHISLASFRKFVEEPFESILFTDTVDDNDNYTLENWKAIKELWHREPCNIFWAGADTFMVQPTSLFGEKFKEYRLFNYTDPRQHREFENYFNDDVQYFPHTMSQKIWEIGEKYWEQREGHPDRYWGFDQLRHNAMFWAQDIPENDRCHPKLAYQCPHLRVLDQRMIDMHDQWNGVALNTSHILHFHASRGTEACISIMSELCQQLDIQL
jgi:hypothetical protein